MTLTKADLSEILFNKVGLNKSEAKEMVEAFVNGLLTDGKAPISFEDIISVTKASFKVLESVKRGGEQVIV